MPLSTPNYMHVLIVWGKQKGLKTQTTIFGKLWKSACKWKAAKNAKVFTLWRCGKFLCDECLAAARWEDGKSVWSRVRPALWVKCRWIADKMFALGCPLLTSFGVKWSRAIPAQNLPSLFHSLITSGTTVFWESIKGSITRIELQQKYRHWCLNAMSWFPENPISSTNDPDYAQGLTLFESTFAFSSCCSSSQAPSPSFPVSCSSTPPKHFMRRDLPTDGGPPSHFCNHPP